MIDNHFTPKETHGLKSEARDAKIYQESIYDFKIRRVYWYQCLMNVVNTQGYCYERDDKIRSINQKYHQKR